MHGSGQTEILSMALASSICVARVMSCCALRRLGVRRTRHDRDGFRSARVLSLPHVARRVKVLGHLPERPSP
jgi:hypothetical protein